MIKQLFALTILVILTCALHLPNEVHVQQLISHRLTDTYMNHLQEPSNKTDPKIVQSHLDLINNQLSLLEQTYKQFNALSDIEAIGTEGTLIKCKNVSKEDEVYVKHALENVDTDLWMAYFEIQQLIKEGQAGQELSKQYQGLKTRKQILSVTQINYCPQNQPLDFIQTSQQQNSYSDISTNAFVSNLNADNNWTFGKWSQQQYEINQFQLLLNNDVIQCPKEAPFATKGKCIACQDNEIFSLDTSVCGKCPSGTVFNGLRHSCEVSINFTCSGNKVYNNNTKKCECPSGLQYFDGTNCIGCFIPKFWNSKTLRCQSCQKGSFYSLQKEKCLSCPQESNFISSLSGCHDQCTLSKPYFDGQLCISCPQIFNQDTRRCQECPSGLVFDFYKGVCVQKDKFAFRNVNCDKGFVFNSQNGQCVKQTECSCPSNYVYNQKTAKCQCPENLPFDAGVNCVRCDAPSSWDQESRKCVQPMSIDAVPIAPIPIIKNVTTTTPNTLIPIVNVSSPLNTTASSISKSPAPQIVPTCNAGEIWNKVSKTCVCGHSTPYRTLSGGCISCNVPNTWSQTLHKCLQPAVKCKSNYVYEANTQSCVCPGDMPFNDGQQCQSCYLPMYWNNVDRKCLYCLQNQYFNPMLRKCEFCPQSRPLLFNHVCQACPQGSQYNKSAFRCQTITCVNGAVYSEQINDCSCLDRKKPFYNGRECVSCRSPNRWDLVSRSCVYGTPQLLNSTTSPITSSR